MKKYVKAPMLSTSFSQSGKSAKKRFENILNMSLKRKGRLAFVFILCMVLGISTLVACDNKSSSPKQEQILEPKDAVVAFMDAVIDFRIKDMYTYTDIDAYDNPKYEGSDYGNYYYLMGNIVMDDIIWNSIDDFKESRTQNHTNASGRIVYIDEINSIDSMIIDKSFASYRYEIINELKVNEDYQYSVKFTYNDYNKMREDLTKLNVDFAKMTQYNIKKELMEDGTITDSMSDEEINNAITKRKTSKILTLYEEFFENAPEKEFILQLLVKEIDGEWKIDLYLSNIYDLENIIFTEFADFSNRAIFYDMILLNPYRLT